MDGVVIGDCCDNPLTIEQIEYSLWLNQNKLTFYQKHGSKYLKEYEMLITAMKSRLEKLTSKNQ